MIMLMLALAIAGAPVKDTDVQKRFSPEYRQCAPVAADDLSRVNCIVAELQKQDIVLEQVIEKRTRKLRAAGKRAYVKQQYAWLSGRNRQCLRDSKSGPGPIFAEQLKCRLFETVRRTIELERAR